MAKMTDDERERRKGVMFALREWLSLNGKNQRWLGTELGIYHGYVSNLLTGKQIPSVEVVDKAVRIMGPRIESDGPDRASSAGDTAPAVHTNRSDNVENSWRKSKKQVVKRSPKSTRRTLERKTHKQAPTYSPATRRLTPEEIRAVGDLTVSLIQSSPTMSADELVMVVKGFSRGFASPLG